MKFPIENPRKQVKWEPQKGLLILLSYILPDNFGYILFNGLLLISAPCHKYIVFMRDNKLHHAFFTGLNSLGKVLYSLFC